MPVPLPATRYPLLAVVVKKKGRQLIRCRPCLVSELEHVLGRVAAVWVRAVLEGLELLEDRVAVERPDVARLRLGESTDGPREVHEVRLDWAREWHHADLDR